MEVLHCALLGRSCVMFSVLQTLLRSSDWPTGVSLYPLLPMPSILVYVTPLTGPPSACKFENWSYFHVVLTILFASDELYKLQQVTDQDLNYSVPTNSML